MRELKFRAWQPFDSLHRSKGMYKVQGIEFNYDNFDESEAFLTDEYGDTKSSEYLKDIVLMQYTGLKDKKGVEGCHKDIIRMYMFFFTIEWDYKTAKFYLKSANEIDKTKWSMTHFVKKGVVVGNIYENPELLEKQ